MKFAGLAAPLGKKIRKDQPMTFNSLHDEETQSVNKPKDVLMSPPPKVLSNSTSHMTMDTDACTSQVICVFLLQQEDGIAKLIGYWLRPLYTKYKLNKIQHKFQTTAWTVVLMHLYLKGMRFAIRTDHESLKWILNVTDSTGKISR